MLNKINGLPSHILLVHAVVILIPLAAVMAVVAVGWPWARLKLGGLTPLIAFVGLLFVPLTTNAGEWLQEHTKETPLLEKHAELGDGLLVWATLLFVLSAALWLLDVDKTRSWRVPEFVRSGWVRAGVSALLVVVAVISVWQVYRIGDSGAKATWDGRLTSAG